VAHHAEAPGICIPPPLRVRSACSPEELAAGDLVGALLLGWPESPGLLPSLRLRFLQDMCKIHANGAAHWAPALLAETPRIFSHSQYQP
jgi:hypothetical protein